MKKKNLLDDKNKPIAKTAVKKDVQVIEKTNEEEIEEERIKLELESRQLKEKEEWDKLTTDEKFYKLSEDITKEPYLGWDASK